MSVTPCPCAVRFTRASCRPTMARICGLVECPEDDDLVDAVDELGAEWLRTTSITSRLRAASSAALPAPCRSRRWRWMISAPRLEVAIRSCW